MKAIAIVPGTAGTFLADRPEPTVTTPDAVLMRVVSVGICGTDRDEVSGGRAQAPDGQRDLVIGHEMLGQVVSVGSAVKRVAIGDHAVFTVRRGCGRCASCGMGRSDMCETGGYRERGIRGLDGYQTEYVADQEEYVVRVPAGLASAGVLVEPLSIVEKAIGEALRVQVARRPDAATMPDWIAGRRCLVAGLGPVGLLAAMVLSLRGAEVYGLDVVDAGTARPAWLRALGAQYVDGRHVPADRVESVIGPAEVIVEATGVAALEFNLLDALARNGVYALTGLPTGDRPLQIPGAELIRRLVLSNQVMFGSVNASAGHFQMAVDDLARAQLRWPGHIARLVTHYPPDRFSALAARPEPDAIKEVIDWGDAAAG